jgi:hypothetical protein
MSTIHEKLVAKRGNYNYREDITAEELKRHFAYDPETGRFDRLTRKNSSGSKDRDGYLILKIERRQYKAHRMAWLYVHGSLPMHNIDHINGDRTDNRIANLRDAPQAVNVMNTKRKPNKDTGVVGVYMDKCTKGLKKKFTRRINGRTYRFYSVQDALSFSPSAA